ncbi:hypothetical protein INT45_011401 [Circinella minor]|uniref:Kinetochore protein Nuf2 N-terminal domain-containing protein n=1 Tax=Circinella minor TaxID=1195481 RepID=A0A8H7SCX2_9FUNG|nr:hypothetical protein INT45_011401 [Circinella minor]
MQRFRNAILFESEVTAETEFNLPTLSTADLVHCFRAMQIDVTERDLLHPTPESTQEIFRTILGLVKSWRIKHVPRGFGENITLASINGVSLLYYEMQDLLSNLGHKDFTTSDLLFPTPHRLARILSALANFAMFREERWADYETPAGEVEEISLREESAFELQRQLKLEIEQHREYDEEQDLQVQQLELDNSEYEKELRAISAEGDALKTEHDKLRETRRQLKDFMQDVQYKLLTMKEGINSFQSRANYDPVQAAANIAKLKEKSLEYQSTISSIQKQLQLANERLEYVETYIQEIEIGTQKAQEIQRLRNECDWVKNSMIDVQGNIEKVTQKCNELQETQKKLHQSDQALKGRVQELEEQEEKTRESRHQKFLKITREFEGAQKEALEINTKVLRHKAKIAEVEQELEDVIQTLDTKVKEVQTHVKELESAKMDYMDKVRDACT